MKTIKNIASVFLLLIPAVLLNTASAQQLSGDREQADKYFSEMNFSRAVVLYERLNAKKEKPEYVRAMAQCYRHLRAYEPAEKWYSRLVEMSKTKPEDHYWYARMLQANEKYSAALSEFVLAGKNTSINPVLLKTLEESCLKSDSMLAHPGNYQVAGLGSINSTYSEFGAVPYRQGIVFASDRPNTRQESDALAKPMTSGGLYAGTGTPFVKMYYARISESNKAGSKGHGPADAGASVFKKKKFDIELLDAHLNEAYHNGPAAFNKSETRIYYTRTREVKRPHHQEKGNPSLAEFSENSTIDYINQLEIWYSDKTEKGWSEPHSFLYNSGANYSVGHPALSPDGKTLYFASDMPGGRGGMDLYSCQILESGFAKPVNLGSRINTPGDEEFPSISAKGTLYFASNGHMGIGGLDIFKSHPGATWSQPENLGSPVNTSKDDFAFLTTAYNESRGYLSSNRKGTLGGDDLYEFIRDIKRILSVQVKDEHNKPIAGARMELVDSQHPEGHVQTTDESGNTILESTSSEITRVKASKEGFKMFERSFAADSLKEANDSISIVITLIKLPDLMATAQDSATEPPQKGYFVHNIYYSYNRFNLKTKARQQLEQLCLLLKKYPKVVVEIGSHTDSRGSDAYNMKLSRQRANAVVDFLSACGVSRERLQARGYGESQIMNKCKNNIPCTEAEHQQNRRTEFKIVK